MLPLPVFAPAAPVVWEPLRHRDPLKYTLDPRDPLPDDVVLEAVKCFPGAMALMTFSDGSLLVVYDRGIQPLDMEPFIPTRFGDLLVAVTDDRFSLSSGESSGDSDQPKEPVKLTEPIKAQTEPVKTVIPDRPSPSEAPAMACSQTAPDSKMAAAATPQSHVTLRNEAGLVWPNMSVTTRRPSTRNCWESRPDWIWPSATYLRDWRPEPSIFLWTRRPLFNASKATNLAQASGSCRRSRGLNAS
ncbi:hypothetical protein FN846DRAFT_216135 [Sphaerosporella brunnea]|uniref:Uncharacterized protein n=1 Tax=Sphaerosporella brunnea TaxID=1250544 RepID=A0A5J5F7G4_9PEZI|nr:hypothetical protein FN846DRAFT_216135 [Sphaerosporella brunnea]